MGNPLRIVDTLPGVIPLASGVPYVYVRGAPPAAQGYVYDGIPLPQLFHAAFGPAVIHPRATGQMELLAGVPSAMYGRRAGGLLLAEGVLPSGDFNAEVELRLLDVNGWVESPVGNGAVVASARIGYPQLALKASESLGVIEKGTRANYWDGQLRYRVPLTSKDMFELVFLGSFDNVNLPGIENQDQVRSGSTALEFYRLETRVIHQLARGEVATALRFGFDSSEIAEAVAVRAFTVGPRVWSRFRLRGGHTLKMGADLYASTGDVKQSTGALGSPEGNIQVSLPTLAEASARNQGGVWAETMLNTSARTRLDVGLRFDYWSVSSQIDVAVDPRLRFTFEATEDLSLHVAAGTGHQPAVFLLPLPGLSDVAVADGLTRSIQSEAGFGYDLPFSLRLESQAFLHHYDRLLLPELIQDAAIPENPPLSSAIAYGGELFLKRDPSEDFSGWISYTLGWAEADSGKDVIGKFKPDFDVRHVVNAVASWRLPRGFVVGGRVQARSGRMIEQLNPRYQQRLPWFFRADARVGYSWDGRFGKMLAYLEWFNVTIAREYLDADCFFGQCSAEAAPPLALPNIGIRAEL
ncbi:MAG: TonB-dependent receptor [Polyangiaceae bacterium]